MPELPEVETVRRGLMRLVQGATIQRVEVRYPKMVAPAMPEFAQQLAGQTIDRIDRRGKFLLFRLGGLTLVSHLRMEGKYDVQPEGAPTTKHTHVIFHLTDQRELRYTDTRKFGRMQLIKTGEEAELPALKKMGPEPTETSLTLAYLQKIFAASKKAVKPFLLDQTKIAGLGNIYADEVLWLSRIHPLTPANTLTTQQLTDLRRMIIQELATAIAGHGTTVHSFSTAYGEAGEFQNSLHVYGRNQQPCDRCGKRLVKIKVAQRGTTYCPHCQVLPGDHPATVVWGLTGGIATGKSTVSTMLGRAGLPIIDADLVAREVVAPGTSGLKAIVATFGSEMLTAQHHLNRSKLGQLVFNDPQALQRLTAITDPLIRETVMTRIAAAKTAGAPAVIVDAATLFEAHYEDDVDAVMVVTVGTQQQLTRLMARDHLSEQQAQARIQAQWPVEDKVARATKVIDNSGTIAQTQAQVVEWLDMNKLGDAKQLK